jgi:hypothetical protein
VCIECLQDNPTDLLESLEDNPRKALNLHEINPADHGYTLIQKDFENGMHPGQTDNPTEIYKKLRAEGHKHILFRIDDVGQFDMSFSVWTRNAEES